MDFNISQNIGDVAKYFSWPTHRFKKIARMLGYKHPCLNARYRARKYVPPVLLNKIMNDLIGEDEIKAVGGYVKGGYAKITLPVLARNLKISRNTLNRNMEDEGINFEKNMELFPKQTREILIQTGQKMNTDGKMPCWAYNNIKVEVVN